MCRTSFQQLLEGFISYNAMLGTNVNQSKPWSNIKSNKSVKFEKTVNANEDSEQSTTS